MRPNTLTQQEKFVNDVFQDAQFGKVYHLFFANEMPPFWIFSVQWWVVEPIVLIFYNGNSVWCKAILSVVTAFHQILTELEYSGVGRNKEQSARMLGHLVSNAPRLIRPYMEPILKVRCSHQINTVFLYSTELTLVLVIVGKHCPLPR